MQKLIQKIKMYRPSKSVCYLWFFIPIIICAMTKLDKENDIWFLLNHGKYVLENGFPIIEPFTIHQNFSFVMQQWLSAVIFFIAHYLLGQYGLLIVLEIVNCFLIYFLYKLCMVLTEERFRVSTFFTCITMIFLSIFFVPRPWMFTFLILVITLYIMELYYQKKSKKVLYFLLLLSILQINIQSSMWFMLFLFILPYFVCLLYQGVKEKNSSRIRFLFLIVIVMFLLGFINPYGIKNMFYVFSSYGNRYINEMIIEMFPPTISSSSSYGDGNYGKLTFFLLFVIVGIYIFHKKGKIQMRHMFLLFGVTVLVLLNIRNLGLFVLGSIPFLSAYVKDLFPKKKENDHRLYGKARVQYRILIIGLVIYTICIGITINKTFTSRLEKGITTLLKEEKKENIKMYANYNTGSYVEYRGISSYIDGRAEVFLKSNNKKKDIMKEYYLLSNGDLDYNEFIEKYQFTHLLIMKYEKIYQDALKDERYKIVFKDKNYAIFERIS